MDDDTRYDVFVKTTDGALDLHPKVLRPSDTPAGIKINYPDGKKEAFYPTVNILRVVIES